MVKICVKCRNKYNANSGTQKICKNCFPKCKLCDKIVKDKNRTRKQFCNVSCAMRVVAPKAEKHYRWKGNEVGYKALHDWVRSRLGRPSKCEQCGKNNLKGIQIHWANKSQKYLRELNDWLRLCAKCHKKYDARK